ncbi:NAD-dependent succinate-semialdehyde dehydrogenase [Rhodocytophaga aerolata]|uniref:NAD-dependent succinate-semialdehyde dehydrogenase n=1 Tax=Rhodocytophaga aerolata TaxID=455078 RepID=A0ABT8R5K6_9BACT|nr:NAD-dependent succinate-semialdehyde dehydrogenase [Rhodocytophaga aerolata]MDO1447380.1 NAD-dependent succinate-semialdehyde dehydrogenase [Rhodocytophaga aerolata]
MPIQSINPYTNKVIKSFEEDSEDKVNQVVELAGDTFRFWKKTTFTHRSELMRKTAKILRAKAQVLAKLMAQEMGKPLKEGIEEINKCALTCDYYADNAEKFLQDEVIQAEGTKNLLIYQPIGAILAIMPWNFPFWQVFRFAAPTLMAGNVGLLKHASNVPQCAMAIESIFLEAGFPQGVFQTLLVGSDKVEKLIAHDYVQAVTLTGSEAAGSKVAALAGKYIKKSVMELGGSDPFIVLPDADLDYAAQMAVKGRMINTGQSCICAKRFIVFQNVADKFTQLMTNYMLKLKMGNPLEEGVDYGPMARQDLANELVDQVKRSVDKGAVIVTGGGRPVREGAFFNATILTNVRPGTPAYEEEMFGPVAAIITVRDEEEAIAIANDSRYGLGGSVWTKDLKKGEAIARKIESGFVTVNDIVKSDPRLPFGGIKKSGYGRELSHLGIREFMNIKTLRIK